MYIISSCLTILTAACAALAWPGLRGATDRIIAWLLLVPALITAGTLALGLSGQLTPLKLLLLFGSLALTGLIFVRRRLGDNLAHAPTRVWRAIRAIFSRRWLWPLAAGWVAIICWTIYVGLRVPPFGWDGLSYHIPPAVWWLQGEAIRPVPSQFPFGYAYPQGMSLLMLWQLAFTTTDRLVNLVQLPFTLLGAAAAYGLAREAGVGRPWAGWATAFWVLAPLTVAQAVVPYTDIAVGALTLTAFYFCLRSWRRKESHGHLALAGVAAGLLLGMKANGFLTLALVCLMALVPLHAQWHVYRRQLARRLALLVLPCVLLAGYWYGRNLVLYHNPIFPVAVSVMGRTLLPGPNTVRNLINATPTESPWQSFSVALKESVGAYSYDSPHAGFGAAFTCVGIAAMAAALLHALLTRRLRMAALLAAGALLLLLQPFKYPRYLLYLPGMAGAAFGYMLQHVAGRRSRQWLQAAACALLLLTLFLVPYQPQLSAENLWEARAADASGSLWAGDFGHARHYAFMAEIPELSHPENRIAFTVTDFVYPLMGPGRQNQVYYVPALNYTSWLDEVLRAHTTFLLVNRDTTKEFAWAQEHPERFVVWARAWPATIYLVKSDEERNQMLLQQLIRTGGMAQ